MIQIHTTKQPDSDITAFILSCNRLDLLNVTVQSFLETRDLPTKVVIVDDSGVPQIFDELVKKYGDFADIICFPVNRGIFWAKDFMTSYCYTKYIFYVEEDWKFLDTGYLTTSKEILEEFRDIGVVDLSWRTFEEEGFDAYDPVIYRDKFSYKKPWRISHKHLHWFVWCGSPNLKRREDLILLGRTEECPNEWSLDRKFFALGFKGVYVRHRYVNHIGDYRSVAAVTRTREDESPATLFPEELKQNCLTPPMNYHALDQQALNLRGNCPDKRNPDISFVTCLLDINRHEYDNRDFVDHYVNGLEQILKTAPYLKLFVFVDYKYYEYFLKRTGGMSVHCQPIDLTDVTSKYSYPKIQKIVEDPAWFNQAQWMSNSVIRDPNYIGLTLLKMTLMLSAHRAGAFGAKYLYWIDSGICKSYNIPDLSVYNFNKLPQVPDKFVLPRFRYTPEPEIHGFNKQGYLDMCGQIPDYVCRATLFGGDRKVINEVWLKYAEFKDEALKRGYIGTEESILSGVILQNPELFHPVDMPNGDIKHFLASIKTR